jgi:tRNA pseudouridine38-40 synthase
MTVAYDGSGYHGMAVQPGGVPTVGGEIVAAVEKVTGEAVKLVVAGRTDAGVHALGQVVSFDLPGVSAGGFDPTGFRRSLNGLLAPSIVVSELEDAPADFDARRSALSRKYRYSVLSREVPDPFLARTHWHVTESLDLRALRLACDPIIGEHDFSSFCRAPRRVEDASMVRRVLDARWSRAPYDANVLWFEIEASSFCQQMVRALVGLMVAMGAGKRRAGEMSSVLRARSRAAAVQLAPPHGLCLLEVKYPPMAT